jgi:hypothetical protein
VLLKQASSATPVDEASETPLYIPVESAAVALELRLDLGIADNCSPSPGPAPEPNNTRLCGS